MITLPDSTMADAVQRASSPGDIRGEVVATREVGSGNGLRSMKRYSQ